MFKFPSVDLVFLIMQIFFFHVSQQIYSRLVQFRGSSYDDLQAFCWQAFYCEWKFFHMCWLVVDYIRHLSSLYLCYYIDKTGYILVQQIDSLEFPRKLFSNARHSYQIQILLYSPDINHKYYFHFFFIARQPIKVSHNSGHPLWWFLWNCYCVF